MGEKNLAFTFKKKENNCDAWPLYGKGQAYDHKQGAGSSSVGGAPVTTTSKDHAEEGHEQKHLPTPKALTKVVEQKQWKKGNKKTQREL